MEIGRRLCTTCEGLPSTRVSEHRTGRTTIDSGIDPAGREPSERPSARARAERIYRTLRDRICLLDYPPGARLSEEELAVEFEISRTPLRKVLARLEAEGLIASQHGVGTIVTDVDVEALAQVYALRMELAALLGRLDPVPFGPARIARIRAMIAECDAIAGQGDARAFAALNMAFVQEVGQLTGNRPLREISERLYLQVARVVVTMMPDLGRAAEFRAFRQEMAEVLAAAETGDWEAIGDIRRAHISMSFTRMLQNARARANPEEASAQP
jgi:DNA-binding GntR family transcriptional regulator